MQRAKIFLVSSCPSINLKKREVSGGEVSQSLRCATSRQRTKSWNVNEQDALLQPWGGDFHYGANNIREIARVSWLGHQTRKLLNRDKRAPPIPMADDFVVQAKER
jgi:hypothetical protein